MRKKIYKRMFQIFIFTLTHKGSGFKLLLQRETAGSTTGYYVSVTFGLSPKLITRQTEKV